jgi:hypothetical protein
MGNVKQKKKTLLDKATQREAKKESPVKQAVKKEAKEKGFIK